MNNDSTNDPNNDLIADPTAETGSTAEPHAGRIAAVVEFSPRVVTRYEPERPARFARLIDSMIDPLWWWTSKHVDDWGRDDELTNVCWRASKLRWSVSVGGAEVVRPGAGLFVINQRRFSMAPLWAALALGASLDRPVRFAGRPELPGIGPFLQRIGGLLPVEDDIAGALRSEQLVVVGAQPTVTDRRCGSVDATLVGTAVRLGAPVYPAATASSTTGRNARLDVLAPMSVPGRKGLLAAVELAEAVQVRIDETVSEFGEPGEPRPADVFDIRRRVRR